MRLEKEHTQERVAELALLDPKHYQEIEAGRINVTLASLLGIARALRVKLSAMFEGQ